MLTAVPLSCVVGALVRLVRGCGVAELVQGSCVAVLGGLAFDVVKALGITTDAKNSLAC